MTDERKPIDVHCGNATCGHEWAVGFYPISIPEFAKVAKTRCPKCKARKVFMGIKPRETANGDPYAWLRNGDTGISSETIWRVLMRETVQRPGVPRDPSDFGRCYRLLRVMPGWRARLPEVAEAFPMWRPFVDAWDELTALYEDELVNGPTFQGRRQAPKTYDRLQELRRDS